MKTAPLDPANTARLSTTERDAYARDGFLIRRRVFSALEMAELATETDRLRNDCADLINPANLRCRYMPHVDTGEKLFEVFDPVIDLSPLCTRLTQDERIVGLVESIYGERACLFKEKLIFKPPGAMGYHLHQDIPRAWDGFPQSFLTVLLPIDPGTEENGCTELFRGYHRSGFLATDPENPFKIPDDSVRPEQSVKLALQPGDLAIFHGLTPHRSAPNRSHGPRRAFYISYNAFSDGGDQRAAHYAQFQDRMRLRIATEQLLTPYFR